MQGVVASVSWTELAVRPAGVARQRRTVRDTTDAAGRFVLCDAPLDVESVVTFDDAKGTRREVTAAGSGRLRRANVHWRTSAATARVRVRVSDTAGAIANALVRVAPDGNLVRSDADGWATMPSLALGSWTLDVRALGRTPIRRGVIIRGDTALAVSLPRLGTLVGVRVTVGAAIGSVVGVAVKGPLQEEHQKEPQQHPAHRRLQVAVELEPGVRQEVEEADAQEHAAGERQGDLHLAVREREERHGRPAREGGRRDQREVHAEHGERGDVRKG